MRPVPDASEKGHPGSQARCVVSSATGLLRSGSRPAPAEAPAPLPLFTEGLGASVAAEFQASTIPRLPSLKPAPRSQPPESHLQPVPWQQGASGPGSQRSP